MTSSPLKEFARYVSLNVLGMIGAFPSGILGRHVLRSLGLGSDGLAALNLAIPVFSFINGSGLMIGMGGGTRYSILKSQGAHREADKIFTNALYLGGAFAVLFFSLGIFAAGPIARGLGGEGSTLAMTTIYLRVILLFSPMFLANNLLLCFVRNDGVPQLAMAAMVGGSLSNVVLDWIFIFPCGLGIFGAAFATGIAPIVSMIILSLILFDGRISFTPSPANLSPTDPASAFFSGVPSLVTELSSGIVTSCSMV